MLKGKSSTISFSLFIALNALSSVAHANDQIGRFGPEFGWPLIPLHATLLPNGKVFTFGTDGNGTQGAYTYDVWDFYNGWQAHQVLPNRNGTDVFCSGTTLLPSGDVMVAGGDTRNPINFGITATNFFITRSQELVPGGAMQWARWYPTVITLPSGEALVHGGKDGGGAPVGIPERFDGSWHPLWGAQNGGIINNDEGKWFYPRDFVAPDGRVFGISGNVMYYMNWQGEGGIGIAGYTPDKSRSHTSTAVMYQPGKILQVGGSTNGDTGAYGSNQGITVDINGGGAHVEGTPNMHYPRIWANSTVLPNGEVLITGGSPFINDANNASKTAEIWNPNSRQFRPVATAARTRLYHSTSLLLPDGSVLTAGGGSPGPENNLNAEIYYPPYLFHGNDPANDRPVIGDMPTNLQYNNQLTVGYAGNVARVTLVRTGSVTHSFDTGQRFQELGFRNNGGSVTFNMPNSPNIAPPGYYMLFFLNGAGVPSHSKMLYLGNGGGGPVANPNPGPGIPPGGGGGGPTTPPAGGGGVNVQPNGVYSMAVRATGRCVDIPGSSPDNNVQAQQYDCNGTNAQRFRMQPSPQGGYNIVNVNSGKCLDVEWGRPDDGTRILQYDCNGSPNQSWKFQGGVDGSLSVHSDATGKCMDVDGGNPNNGSVVHQWTCFGGSANQEFWFRP